MSVAASRRSPSGSSPRATAASSRCSTARTSCSALAGEVEIAYFVEARRATVEGPVRPLARRGLDHDRARRRADPRGAPRLEHLVTIGACATAGGIQALKNFSDVGRLRLRRLRHAGVHLDARDLDADLRARPGRLRAARLPDQQAPAARGDRPPSCTDGGRSISSTSVCFECKRRGNVCVMVAHGTPCLGPVTHAGLRRALPLLRPRLLRLLRADGDAEHRLADAAAAGARARRRRASSASSARSTSRRSRSRRGRRWPERRTKTIRTDYLARVEGEGAMHGHDRRRRGRPTSSSRSTSRRASSRRSCAAVPSPRRPTSRPGSAGSARSPTR